jgi:hypothetical protein
MPTSVRYPLERCRALQEKWLQVLHKEPPPHDDYDEDEEDEDEDWPAPGSEDTKFGVTMAPEVGHAEAKVYARVQA